ncbi:MAG: flagellar protein FlgN [Clostridiales bacterium]|nr:flagellar protein FlgN [Clostridiales bacterium]
MVKSIKQLEETLLQEEKMYSEILDLGRKKVDVIKGAKLKELEKMTDQEQEYIFKITTFEKIRGSVIANICEELGQSQVATITDCLPLIKKEKERETINKLRNQILSIIEEIKETNKTNEILMQERLDFIQFSIELLTTDPSDGNNYNQSAAGQDKQKTNLFDVSI